jgi:hypothetical protein
MIKNTKHPDNPPSLWDEATEDKLCTQKKTVNRYAGYLTDPVNGHKTPSGGNLAIVINDNGAVVAGHVSNGDFH